VALDFETTGLDLRRDAVVSFGLVPVIGGRVDLSGALYREVSPDVPPSPLSVTIHHLRPQDLALAPVLREVASVLAVGIAGRFVLAWAAEIETAFLARIFGGSPRRWRTRTIDVLRLAVALDRMEGVVPPPGSYRLEVVAARHGVPVEETHHALDDAFMTAELFLVIASRLAGHGYGDVRSFVRRLRPPSTPYSEEK
jgi:DNA polymerase III subunit epsilon